MELWKKLDILRKANEDFLFNYKWQWFCTLNLKQGSDYSMAESKLKKWRINVGINNHILIAYMGVYNTVPQPHIHLLVVVKNRHKKTLLNFNHNNWEKAWSDLTQCQAVIEPVYEREGVANYIAKKNLPRNISEFTQRNNKRIFKEVQSELIQPYNKRLLRKAMIR